MNRVTKLLLMGGYPAGFADIDGVRWYSIKDICINLHYYQHESELKRIRKDRFLYARTKRLQIPGKYKGQKVVCISENDVWGYIFAMPWRSSRLDWFKQECHEALHQYFKNQSD